MHGAGNLKPALIPRGFIEAFWPKGVSLKPSNNMLYLHGPGTLPQPCTPLSWEWARCVLVIGHLGTELPVPGSSAEGYVNAAKPRCSGRYGQNSHVCACCPEHQDGTAGTRPFLPVERGFGTFTREGRQPRPYGCKAAPAGPPSYEGGGTSVAGPEGPQPWRVVGGCGGAPPPGWRLAGWLAGWLAG